MSARVGIKGVRVTRRKFSSTRKLWVNQNDGTKLDKTSQIVDHCHGDREQIDAYFEAKENAIRESLERDVESARLSNVDEVEVQEWINDMHNLLAELEDQKDDVLDLSDISAEESDLEGDDNNDNSNGNNNASTSTKSSLIDDYADTSSEMPDIFEE